MRPRRQVFLAQSSLNAAAARRERADRVGRRNVGVLHVGQLVNAPPRARKAILLHELFHGIVQRKLGLAASELAFQQARRMLFKGRAENERALEINEGIASYTGTAAAADAAADAIASALEALAGAETGESFVSHVCVFHRPDSTATRGCSKPKRACSLKPGERPSGAGTRAPRRHDRRWRRPDIHRQTRMGDSRRTEARRLRSRPPAVKDRWQAARIRMRNRRRS